MDEMIKTLNEQYGISDGRNKLMSLCLVNCYSKINSSQAFDVKLLN